MTQAVSNYFFTKEPKQLFVGAELCARWYLLIMGQPASKSAERVIAYCQEAEMAFSWVLAGKGIASLTGRLSEKKWDSETASVFFDTFGQVAACGDVVINKFLDSKARFTVLGFAADGLAGMVDAKLSVTDLISEVYGTKFPAAIKSVTSLFIVVIGAAVHFGAQHYVISPATLVLETTVFMAKIVHHYVKFDPAEQPDPI